MRHQNYIHFCNMPPPKSVAWRRPQVIPPPPQKKSMALNRGVFVWFALELILFTTIGTEIPCTFVLSEQVHYPHYTN